MNNYVSNYDNNQETVLDMHKNLYGSYFFPNRIGLTIL